MSVVMALAVVVAVVAATITAFRRARRAAIRRFPDALVEELRAHKITCLREPPDRVQLELMLLLGHDEHPGRLARLVPRIRRRPAACAADLRPRTAARRS